MAVRDDESTGIEIDQDLAHEKIAWRIQQVGRVLVALIVLAGLAGLAGRGPASKAEAAAPGGALRLEYDRFARFTAPTSVTLHLAPGAVTTATARLWVDEDYLDGLEIKSVMPEPERMAVGDGRVIFDLPLARPGAAAAVVLRFQGERIGRAAGRVGLVDGPELRFDQFFLP